MRLIRTARSLEQYMIEIVWDDGTVDHVDLHPIMGIEMFEVLVNPELFASVKEADLGQSIEWSNGLKYPVESLERFIVSSLGNQYN